MKHIALFMKQYSMVHARDHIFHDKCSERWLKIKFSCPNCRSNPLEDQVLQYDDTIQ